MPDFGTAGTITVRNNRRKNAVDVKFNQGEYLYFRVKVSGPTASFTFNCNDGAILSSKTADFPNHPQQVYEWTKKAADVHSDDDMHGLRMLFITNHKYTYFVEHRDASNNIIEILKDVDFESQNNKDKFTELLRIFRV